MLKPAFSYSFHKLRAAVFFCGLAVLATTSQAVAQSASPTLAAPVDFHLEVVSDHDVRLSWNEKLLSGDPVERFHVYDGSTRIGFVINSSFLMFRIDRSRNYDFSVSAITRDGEETRKSNRIYLDMPPADRSWDGGNRYLPPLTGVNARIQNQTTAEFSWDAPPSSWRPSESTPYSYSIWIDQQLVAITNERQWRYTDFPANSVTWVGIKAETVDDYRGRQFTMVALDTRLDAGSVITGYPGFFPPKNLRADVYSHNSAEVFWERTQFPQIDNVYVNGVLAGRTEGTSFFLTDLPSGAIVEVALGKAWRTGDNGHDQLLSHVSFDLPGTPVGPGGPVQTISVQDGVILLPDDGWYQVQSASDYQTICEGKSSCAATNGTYNVINLTTGERFENIVVGSDTGGPSSIVVDGNTLSWPDDGWYQIQNASTYATICEGGRSCVVDAGTYIAINHTTGERHENIVVDQAYFGMTDVNENNFSELVKQAFEIITARAFDRRVDEATTVRTGTGSLFFVEESVVGGVATKTWRCSNGGSLTVGVESYYPVTSSSFNYANCKIGGDLINGTASKTEDVNGNYSLRFTDYQLSFEPGGRMHLNGNLRKDVTFRPSFIVQQNHVTQSLDYFFEYPAGRLRVTNLASEYRYLVSRRCCTIEDSATSRSISETSQFEMQPPGTNATFRVSMLTPLTKQADEPGVYFNSGQMMIESTEDGSSVILDAGNGHMDSVTILLDASDLPGPRTLPWTTWADVFCSRPIAAVQQRECITGL